MAMRILGVGCAAVALAASLITPGSTQEVVKVGLILPMTGQQASTGRQIAAAAKLYMELNGAVVAGKKIELVIKDDATVPETTKRVAQELIVNGKVKFIAGFGITPSALAVAPLATQAKVPEIVMAAGTSIITEKSPYIARTSFTLAVSGLPTGPPRPASAVAVRLRARVRRRLVREGSTPASASVARARDARLRAPFRSAPATLRPTRSSSSCRPARAAQAPVRGTGRSVGIRSSARARVGDDQLNGMGDASAPSRPCIQPRIRPRRTRHSSRRSRRPAQLHGGGRL